MLKVVCFDLGGVLVRICRSWAQAVEVAGLPSRSLDALSHPDAIARRSRVVDEYQIGHLDCEAYYRAMSEAVDFAYSPEEVKHLHHAWTLEEYPGAGELVAELNQRAVLTACLSNTNHAHWLRLNGDDGRREYPSVAELKLRLASHLLGAAKPQARIYELAQQQFGCDAAQICFFDDMPENVAAARSCGWHAEHVDHAGDPINEMRAHLAHYAVL